MYHPKNFIPSDYFELNIEVVGELSVVVGETGYYDGKAMAGLWTVGDDEDDTYGRLYYATQASDIEALLDSGLDHDFKGAALTEIQLRIYGFLENLATEIIAGRNDTLYSCPGEDIQRIWKPTAPAEGIAQQPGDETNLEQYLSIYRDTFFYTSPSENMWDFLIAICGSRMQAFENQIQGLKEDPGKFLEYLTDVRDHSHHMVLYTDGSSHPWVSIIYLHGLLIVTRKRHLLPGDVSLTGVLGRPVRNLTTIPVCGLHISKLLWPT